MTSDPNQSDRRGPEEEIERLAQQIGHLIKGVEPQRREELRELAYTLIREEIAEAVRAEELAAQPAPGPFNPLGTGVLIFVLGAGLSFVFGPVGLLLMAGGIGFIVWGALIGWLRKG